MTNFICIFIGIILGAKFGLLGAILGALVCNYLSEVLGDVFRGAGSSAEKIRSNIFGVTGEKKRFTVSFELNRQNFYTLCLFSILGHIAKSKGRVSKDDIAFAEFLMQDFNYSAQLKKIAKEAFRTGKIEDFPYAQVLREFHHVFGSNKLLLNGFLQIQMRAALLDAVMEVNEKTILLDIASIFHIDLRVFEEILSQEQARARFSQAYKKASEKDKQWQNYQQQKSSYQHRRDEKNQQNSGYNYHQEYRQNSAHSYSKTNRLDDAFKVIGIAKTDDFKAVKKAYSKQVNKNHPDKLAGRNLPQEEIELANKKVKEIQEAYKYICEYYGWK
ncbi:MAG: co-chaperone DjlA [Cardiobacteriaceae bacterium]|nr:co-chaperone DjlA [Cardiobacteriaceae bacterium]